MTEAARRANAALYFIDTRGLEALSTHYSAEFGRAGRGRGPPGRHRGHRAGGRRRGVAGLGHGRLLRAQHERLRRRHRAHRPGVARATTCSATCPPRAPRRASSTRSRCGCAAGAWSCARARATTTRAGPARSPRPPPRAMVRRASGPIPALQRALDSPGLLDGGPAAHEHVRAGAVGGRQGAGRGGRRRRRRQDRLRGGDRQRRARHAPRDRRAGGGRSGARGPAGGAATPGPAARGWPRLVLLRARLHPRRGPLPGQARRARRRHREDRHRPFQFRGPGAGRPPPLDAAPHGHAPEGRGRRARAHRARAARVPAGRPALLPVPRLRRGPGDPTASRT